VNPAANVRDPKGSRWYLAMTRPCSELIAEKHLNRQGYVTFLPRHTKSVRHARRVRLVKAPVFPRYIFLRLDLGVDRWRNVFSTHGISTLIMAHERPIVVPEGVVETLAERCDGDGCMHFTEHMRPGQRVRLLGGPFSDALGVLESLDDRGRVQVLLNIMGRSIKVRLSEEWVHPAP
jgi:transcription elongation factor/antiterminator RfaH